MSVSEEMERRRSEEDALLLAAGRGDARAFGDFYDRVAGAVYSLLLAMTGDATSAQDWMQQAMLKVWRQAPKFDPARGRAFSWVVSIARRTALDGLRMAGRESRGLGAFSREMDEAKDVESMRRPVCGEESRRVRHALRLLVPEQREAVERAFLLGMTHEEIADKTGEPLGTIKARIRRGLLRLRELLGEEERS